MLPPVDRVPLGRMTSSPPTFRSACLSCSTALLLLMAANAAGAQVEVLPAAPPERSIEERGRQPSDGEPATYWLRTGVHIRTVERWLGTSLLTSSIPSLGRTKLVYADGTELLFFRERLISVTPGADAAGIAPDGLSLAGPGEVTVFIDPLVLRHCDPIVLDEILKCQMEQCFIYAPPHGHPPHDAAAPAPIAPALEKHPHQDMMPGPQSPPPQSP